MVTATRTTVTAYAEDVVAGRILTGHLVRKACERHLRDLDNPLLEWREHEAQRAVRFIEQLTLFEAQKPFVLEPWQVFIVGSLFGWYLPNGLRRFTQGYVEVARGNGKSPLAAAIGLYCQVGLSVHGAQVFSAATTRDQARIVFKDADNMVGANAILSQQQHMTRMVSSLLFRPLGSVFRPLSADASKMDGLRVLAAMVDELHEHPDNRVLTKLRTGMGKFAGTSSLLFMITTAGYNRETVCYEQHDYSIKVLDGIALDETYFVYIATLDPDDDWTDEAVWAKANPNLGVSIQLATLQQECEQAKAMPGQQNPFKRLRLNIWTEQADRWLDMATWDDQPPRTPIEELSGRPAYVGIDLSSTTDLTSVVFVFPDADGGCDVFPFFFVPEEGARKRAERDRVPYLEWIAQGHITATEGDVVDYDVVREFIRNAREHLGIPFDLKEIPMDSWNSTQLQTQLAADGFTVVAYPQGIAHMTAPSKELERLLIDRKLRHGGHPVLRWMATNVAVKQDAAGNIRPAKDKSTGRIDGIVAMIMGIGRGMVNGTGTSVYEDRGFIVL